MKRRILGSSISVAVGAVLASCQSNLSSAAPPITASFIRGGLGEQVDPGTLARGRTVFLDRCIQCHALPEVARFDARQLTAIVAKMSGRANLSPDQHEAVLKYLLTVRSSPL